MAERFSREQLERYARHIILPEVGGRGQSRLLESRVLVCGAGGLGSPVILYLAAAGIGTIHVVDDDLVDLSNLQRQVLHDSSFIGRPKVESAAAAVAALNPDVRLVPHQLRLNAGNILPLIEQVDVVVDGTDNFPTRFLINDACHLSRRPLVSGAMFRFEGQVTVYPNDGGGDSPCHRCLFPEAPPPGLVPSCQEAGILGVVPGVIGSLQATEVVKLLLGTGSPLVGRLLLYEALELRFREIRLHRDPLCALNGDHPRIRSLDDVDYGEATGCRARS